MPNKMCGWKICLCVFLFLCIGGSPLFAISYSADNTTLTKEQGEDLIVLEGNAFLAMPGFEAYSQRIEIVGAQRDVIRFVRPTTFLETNGVTRIYANSATYMESTQGLEIFSWARIMDTEQEITAQSNYAYIHIPTLDVSMVGDVVVHHLPGNMIAFANTGLYNNSVMTLEGKAEIVIDNNRYFGETLIMDLDTNYFSLNNEVSGTIEQIRSKDDE